MIEPCSPLKEQHAAPSKRNLLKCQRCRRDRQRCTPQTRDWEYSHDKCERCQRMGYDCGPPEMTQRKFRQRGLPVPKLETKPKVIYCSPRPHTDACPAQVNGNAASIRGEARFVLDCSVLITIKSRLAECLAVQQLLLRCRLDLQALDDRAGESPRQDRERQFQAVHTLLRDEFQQMTAAASSQLELLPSLQRKQEKKDLQFWRDKELMLQCQRQLIGKVRPSLSNEEIEMLTPIVDPTLYEFEVLLCTRYVLVDDVSPLRAAAVRNIDPTKTIRSKDYQTAADKIQRFMREMFPKCTNRSDLIKDMSDSHILDYFRAGFPASHIAYWNHDRAMANLLWKNSSCTREMDIFGRTYAHVVTAGGDLEALRFIGQHSSQNQAFRDAGIDAQGRSLLIIAATLGDQDVFTICATRCADWSNDQRLLELAIKAGSAAIVNMIMDHKPAVPPFTDALRLAIEYKRENIAKIFISRIENEGYHDQKELTTLAQLAKDRKLFDLAQALSKIKLPKAEIGKTDDIYDAPFLTTPSFDNGWPPSWSEKGYRTASSSDGTTSDLTSIYADASELYYAFSFGSDMDTEVPDLQLSNISFNGPVTPCQLIEPIYNQSVVAQTEASPTLGWEYF